MTCSTRRSATSSRSSRGRGAGGGSAAAITVAMAAGLVVMVARASKDHWPEAGGAIGQAETFRARVAPLAQADAEVYRDALTILRRREEVSERYRDQTLRDALEKSAEIPVQIAEAGADLATPRRAARREREPGGAGGRRRRLPFSPRAERGRRRRSSRRISARRRTMRAYGTSEVARRGRRGRGQNALWLQRSSIERWRSQRNPRRRSFARPGAFRPAPPRASRSPSSGRARSRASGPGAARPARACASASSTAASTQSTRWSASVQRSVVASVGPNDEVDRRRRHRGRPLRARHRVRRDRPLARPRLRARQRARPRRRLHGQRRRAPRRPALGGGAGLRRRQHEPLDDEEAVRRHPPRAHRQGLLPADGARRLGAQHARRELPVALLVGHLGRAATRRPTRSRSTTTPTRRSSSSRAASTSRSPGREAPASAARATASRPRTCPGSAPSCSASIPS